jgi:hypothetical protein
MAWNHDRPRGVLLDGNDDDYDDDSWYKYKDTVAVKDGWKEIFMVSSLSVQIRKYFLSERKNLIFCFCNVTSC